MTIDSVGLTYDALGRMVEQNRSGTYTQIVYAPTGDKLALMSGQTLHKAFVPLPSGTAVYNSSGLAYYRHADWLGSSRFASTPGRAMYSSTAYAPFGEPYAQAGTTDLSFTGRNSDTAGGSYDFLFREYSTQGRWPSPDPARLLVADLADPQTFNGYSYVMNRPCELLDPTGLAGCGQDPINQTDTIGPLRPGVGGGGWFGARRTGGRTHRGVDIAATSTSPVFGLLPGTVTAVGYSGDAGLRVNVDVGGGYSYTLAHLSVAFVAPGDPVTSSDQLLAYSGRSGNASNLPVSEDHLHLQINTPTSPGFTDPKKFLKAPCPPGVKGFPADPMGGRGGGGAGGNGGGGGGITCRTDFLTDGNSLTVCTNSNGSGWACSDVFGGSCGPWPPFLW